MQCKRWWSNRSSWMRGGISKALVMFDENLKSTLKNEKLTTRIKAVERRNQVEEKLEEAQFSKR